MTRKNIANYPCSVSRTLNIIGDQWSILIVLASFRGIDTFSGLLQRLGISRNILTARLDNMVSNDILEKIPTSSTRSRYVLTPAGKELLPTLMALMQWGDKWLAEGKGEPLRVLDRESHAPIQKMGVVSRTGKYLELDDLRFENGPGFIIPDSE
ncbi:helix-turn-helix domain-containing protein [Vibrio sp. FNV 38]|nr:helix-turn-helix domain-containing protein [Vibrio sp. FNV 38]